MKERLVDVKLGQKVLHTFPVALSDPLAGNNDEPFKQKAREAAANAKLVDSGELSALTADMHAGRGGPLEPYGDPLGVLAETKAGLEQFVRDRAYFLWEEAGRPGGQAENFWNQAQYECRCERAHALWVRESRPAGKAHEHWYRIANFERD